MINKFGFALSIALALAMLAFVAHLLNQCGESVTEFESRAAFRPLEDAQPKPGDRVSATKSELDIQSHDSDATDDEIRNGNPSSILMFKQWSEMQAYADKSFGRWDADRPEPDDSGFGYFDGVIGGGFDPAVRFRINSVSLSTLYLEENDTCRLRIDARPLSGQDANAFGVLSIDLTMHDLECQSPEDLVGQRLDFREGDRYAVEFASHYRLGEDGNAEWGTRWVNSSEVFRLFTLHVIALDDGYLIGTVYGLLYMVVYQGEDVFYQRRQGRLIGTFRARI